MGAGGIFISSMNPKSPGEVVELTFTIPDNKKTLKLKGKVMWSQKPGISDKKSGMGIQFIDYSRTERKNTRRIYCKVRKLSNKSLLMAYFSEE